MSKRDAVVLGSRLLALLLTVWALSELLNLPNSVYSLLHYADQVSVLSPAIQYWQHHYIMALGFLNRSNCWLLPYGYVALQMWPRSGGIFAARSSDYGFLERIGAGDRDRTGDIQLGKLAFYR
jgi:hypothetical protein